MDLQKNIIQTMKREEAGAVPMRMRWVQADLMSIQSTMEVFGGGSARRATMALVRPEWMMMAGSTGLAIMSTIVVTVCGPLCI